ncbi:MAG TPA: cytochrome P450 [Sandaracinaceae bacterium LLY-WYZ-13_1]|nr:cytochrome P450 [Sandaracinaceae bacterium LLY-WYZ-13_1]
MRHHHAPPGPPGLPLLGHVSMLWSDPLGNVQRVWRDHGDVVRLRFGPYEYYLVTDLAAIKRVLIDNNRNYVKSRNYRGLKLVLGDGLVTSDGELWRRQRKLAQPAFVKRRIEAFGPSMVALAEDQGARWDRRPDGAVVDVHDEMMRLTFRIVGRTLFDMDFEDAADDLGPTISTLVHFANDYAEAIVRLPLWWPLPRHREFARAKARMDRLVADVIARRRASGEEREDLLGLLMSATDEQGRMSESQLRDEVLTLVLAGHETTANALSWTWMLLSRHPDVDRRLEAELDAVLGGRAPTVADLPELVFTDRVVRESMRLYPPVWAFERDALEDDELAGYRVPAGATVGISPFVLHRHPAHWENAEGFDPDRFAPERSGGRSRFAYLPFGAGPRQCIGMGMALMEAVLLLATLRQRHRLELVPGHPIAKDASITLRPRHGLRVRLRRRGRSRRPSPRGKMRRRRA